MAIPHSRLVPVSLENWMSRLRRIFGRPYQESHLNQPRIVLHDQRHRPRDAKPFPRQGTRNRIAFLAMKLSQRGRHGQATYLDTPMTLLHARTSRGGLVLASNVLALSRTRSTIDNLHICFPTSCAPNLSPHLHHACVKHRIAILLELFELCSSQACLDHSIPFGERSLDRGVPPSPLFVNGNLSINRII